VPAAGLFQAQTRIEGIGIGIEYVSTSALRIASSSG